MTKREAAAIKTQNQIVRDKRKFSNRELHPKLDAKQELEFLKTAHALSRPINIESLLDWLDSIFESYSELEFEVDTLATEADDLRSDLVTESEAKTNLANKLIEVRKALNPITDKLKDPIDPITRRQIREELLKLLEEIKTT